MKDRKFEVGNKVRVKKPKDVIIILEWPYWNSEMNEYDGKEYVIKCFVRDDTVLLDSCTGRASSDAEFPSFWRFNTNWLTLVKSAEGLCLKCGSEMEEILLLTSTTKICPKCGE
jgi:hypothetical protein